jgi:hypothetical protein
MEIVFLPSWLQPVTECQHPEVSVTAAVARHVQAAGIRVPEVGCTGYERVMYSAHMEVDTRTYLVAGLEARVPVCRKAMPYAGVSDGWYSHKYVLLSAERIVIQPNLAYGSPDS